MIESREGPTGLESEPKHDDGEASNSENFSGKENDDYRSNKRQTLSMETMCENEFCFACNESLSKSREVICIAGKAHKWHPECFVCSICRKPMDTCDSCHLFKEQVVCRNDFLDLRHKQRTSVKCARCGWPIGPADWVRRAAEFVYHLACFNCDICLRQLNTGDQFTLSVLDPRESSDVKLLCRFHFSVHDETSRKSRLLHKDLVASTTNIATNSNTNSIAIKHCSLAGQNYASLHIGRRDLSSASSTSSISSSPPSCSPVASMGAVRRAASSSTSPIMMRSNAAGPPQAGDCLMPNSSSSSTKSKRIRTTFTDDQLSILQTHFQIDSNPDGQDLERIATITGLSKRVTQVWFQNSRARQKKYLVKKKPSSSATAELIIQLSHQQSPLQSHSHQ